MLTLSNRLRLYFKHDNQDRVNACLDALRTISQDEITFTSEASAVDMRDVLTKPEFMEVKSAVVLVFENPEQCRRFMLIPGAKGIFDRYAESGDRLLDG